jgi:beta-barrel assembly-enhancing protease
MAMRILARRAAAWAVAMALVVAGSAGAQTRIVPPQNKYTPQQDIELGTKAAAEVRRQMPLVNDAAVQAYITRIGQRLEAAIPPELATPAFHYTFQVVNASDINAFALPGGPMFVNRGMIAAAHSEGEVAGVMAHEMSHVVLRHGTAQATKATPYEIGAVAGAILGAIVGGTAGSVISQGSQFGIGAAFLRYSREYEKQADLLGTHIMARAGYDPRAMADMFRTIESQGGGTSPQWLSDHPNPGNRVQYIEAEARTLPVANASNDARGLASVQADLRRLPPAATTAQIMKNAEQSGANAQGSGGRDTDGSAAGTSGRLSANVPAPSPRYRTYGDQGGRFRVSVPDNWRQIPNSNSGVRFVPEGGYASSGGREVFTHGVEVGVTQAQSLDLQTATDDLVSNLAQGNPRLRPAGSAQPTTFAGREGLELRLSNVSDATGEPEVVLLTTALLEDGSLAYSIGVAPAAQFATYRDAIQRVNQSVMIRR